METYRKTDRILKGHSTSDGAGVKITRIFGHDETKFMDPFLMLDFFGSDNPDEFMAGFPFHPHRGIETVTYMLEGKVEHSDSMGNKGAIGKGDIQWMTAGSGIIHQEMPLNENGRNHGFQLWVNLPASHKMIAPRYQDIPADSIPVVKLDNGTRVKVLAGIFNGIRGPVEDIIADPEFFDVEMPADAEFITPVNPLYTIFVFVYEGSVNSGRDGKTLLKKGEGAVLVQGDKVYVKAGNSGANLILISGKPIREPIAWRGPIVMNTEAEIQDAFREIREETFIKK